MQTPHRLNALRALALLAGVTLTTSPGAADAPRAADPAAALRGVEWVVQRLDGQPLPAGVRVTLRFGHDGRFSGQAPCNRFIGPWRMVGTDLEIGPAATTLVACADDALTPLEQRFLDTLPQLRAFERPDAGTLRLRGPGGVALEATAP